jgi:hypothetical protein
MLKWLKDASANAQRKNVARTLSLLIPAAAEADARIQQTGRPNPADVQRITSLQKSLLGDLVGPLRIDELREEFLTPVLRNPDHSDGVKTAVQHVFDTAARR